jgi:hypothetical protein
MSPTPLSSTVEYPRHFTDRRRKRLWGRAMTKIVERYVHQTVAAWKSDTFNEV